MSIKILKDFIKLATAFNIDVTAENLKKFKKIKELKLL